MPPRSAVNNVMDSSEWMKPRQQRPARRSFYGALRKESNVKCLILTALIYGCIVAIVWCRVTRVTKVDIDFTAFPITSTREISPCDDGSIYIPTAFVVMLYLLYLVECWHCKAWHQLKFEKTDLNSAYQKIHEVRQAQPVVWWKAVCYHYVRRTREITRYRNGNAYSCSQVYYERVNSHVAAGCFFFALCGMKDVSRELIDLEKHAATKIQLSKGFLFANLATAREFQEQRAAFFQEQERFDDYMEMREGMDLSNVHFKESLISWASPDNPPWFAKVPVFWLCNFLLLSWPLRLILELNTAHVHHQVNKLFGVNYMSPSGSEMLLSAPRSHGLPVNNQQHRIHNRAISSHHSRLTGHHHRGYGRVPVADVDHDETAPLLSSSDASNQQHDPDQEQLEPNQYFNNNNSQQLGKSEKDSQELTKNGCSAKIFHEDQQPNNNNNNDNSNDNENSTNHNNNNITSSAATTTTTAASNSSPTTSSSSRLFFPWRSSFFTRNFRFARQSGYKLTRSVTLLMTKPERLQFLASTQHQFPDDEQFGYYGDSDEGTRLLHDESYYPTCSSPPPPPFLTPSSEEAEQEEEEVEDGGGIRFPSRASSSANNGNGNGQGASHRRHYTHHHELAHRRISLVMTGEEEEEEDGNSNTNCLAPSYSQALLSMEPNERKCVVAYQNRNKAVSNSSATSGNINPSSSPAVESPPPPPPHPPLSSLHLAAADEHGDGEGSAGNGTSASLNRRNSSGSIVAVGLGTANLTNEQQNPAGFMNVTGIGNGGRACGSSTTNGENWTSGVDVCGALHLFSGECTGEQQHGHCGLGGNASYTHATHYLQQHQHQQSASRHNNCPGGIATSNTVPPFENPRSVLSDNEQGRAFSHRKPGPLSQQLNGRHNSFSGNQPDDSEDASSSAAVDDLPFYSNETTNLLSSNNPENCRADDVPVERTQEQPGSSTLADHPHRHYQRTCSRLGSSGSSIVLNSVAPREMSGVQIDLTQPIVVTVPRDPLRETAALGAMARQSSTSSSNSASATTAHHHYHLSGNPNASFGKNDEPPSYLDALRTSRPVFLPTLARIRRCFTERDIASRFSSNRSTWLDEIEDGESRFLQNGMVASKNSTGAAARAPNHRANDRSHGAGSAQPRVGADSGTGSSTSRV